MKHRKVQKIKKRAITQVRVGLGYDIHRLVKGRKLILGGVHIPSKTGLLGYSDADVLLHAICDSLLGAAALGDIGKHFPDTDETYRNISSIRLLERVGNLLDKRCYQIINIDSTIILENPKIAKYVDTMRQRIGNALSITADQISIKATTHEGLGPLGKGKGCAAHAIAAIMSASGI